jgi:hypothetical protein
MEATHGDRVDRTVESLVREGFRSVILVEGTSDRSALSTLAERRDRNLRSEGVAILPIGGATNAGHFLRSLTPRGFQIAGLCDVGEERSFRKGLEGAGIGSNLTREGMESLGFFVCIQDLEDELIRALGTEHVERVIDDLGDGESFRRFRAQPTQRMRTPEEQLRRFMGTRSGRKARYGNALVDAMDLGSVPRPLEMVLGQV